jgi:hypothetical protein
VTTTATPSSTPSSIPSSTTIIATIGVDCLEHDWVGLGSGSWDEIKLDRDGFRSGSGLWTDIGVDRGKRKRRKEKQQENLSNVGVSRDALRGRTSPSRAGRCISGAYRIPQLAKESGRQDFNPADQT